MRLGIDVGGTNTDAVLIDGQEVIAWNKTPTTTDVGEGIALSIRAVLAKAGIRPDNIDCVMIGTTHFTNACVERRHLLEVGVIRLALPSGAALPPMCGWPADLRRAMGGTCFQLPGGYEFDGAEIAAFDEWAVRDAARAMRRAGLRAAAVSSAFAPINRAMEQRAAAILAEECPGIAISLSSDLGRIGLLERENATIMNAALTDLAGRVSRSFGTALLEVGIHAPFYVSQNDGTLMSADHVARFPVLTFGSGPANSMRGAAFLTNVRDAIIMDIGGTTADIGALVNGFPRESAVAVDIGGVRTNFRMPDILALGLGGGTRIHLDPALYGAPRLAPEQVRIGPDSVGFRLLEDAFLFGGTTLTASDVAVAGGLADFGDRSRLPPLSSPVVRALLDRFRDMLADGVDRMKTAAGEVPVILVGGGAILVEDGMRGASQVLRPAHAGVANAIGAAIAQVGGEADRMIPYAKVGRDTAIETVKRAAFEQVVAAGADPATVRLVEVEEVAISYLPDRTVNVRAKAVGDLAL